MNRSQFRLLIAIAGLIFAVLFVSSELTSPTWASTPAREPGYSSQIVAESSLPPPTASFALQAGQSFSYLLSVDSTVEDERAAARTKILSMGLGGFPELQRISCLGLPSPDSTQTFRLVNQAKFINTRGAIDRRNVPPFYREVSTAVIESRTGQIVREVRTQSHRPGQVDTLGGNSGEFLYTLWEFYGRWMLYLADDFHYERVETVPLIGQVKTIVETVGRDTIDGRDCFAVRFHRLPVRAAGIEKLYWVDTKQRVTVRVTDAGLSLKLVTPPTDSLQVEP